MPLGLIGHTWKDVETEKRMSVTNNNGCFTHLGIQSKMTGSNKNLTKEQEAIGTYQMGQRNAYKGPLHMAHRHYTRRFVVPDC